MADKKEKRCLTCGKLLIGEKLPLCIRCRLQGRNAAGKGGEMIVGGLLLFAGAKGMIDQNKNDESTEE